MSETIFNDYSRAGLTFKNRIAMAPMTRSRAIGNIPNDLMVEYYKQRSQVGLIITEGTSPSPNGLGYARIPGLFNQDQVVGWKKITDAIHEDGSKIFIQLMHTGRVSHPDNMIEDSSIVAPSPIAAAGDMWTDNGGMQAQPVPTELSAEGIRSTIEEYVHSANLAIEAGFDGVELHAANGYLPEQFLSPHSNQRQDSYGGSVVNRVRFVLEITEKIAHAIGKEKTGIRFSPFGTFNDMPAYDETFATYDLLSKELGKMEIAYLHLIDNPGLDKEVNGFTLRKKIRTNFSNTLILANGYDLEKANLAIEKNEADMVAFGRPFISNPDLVVRMEKKLPLSTEFDATTLYSPGEKGYTDYAFANA